MPALSFNILREGNRALWTFYLIDQPIINPDNIFEMQSIGTIEYDRILCFNHLFIPKLDTGVSNLCLKCSRQPVNIV